MARHAQRRVCISIWSDIKDTCNANVYTPDQIAYPRDLINLLTWNSTKPPAKEALSSTTHTQRHLWSLPAKLWTRVAPCRCQGLRSLEYFPGFFFCPASFGRSVEVLHELQLAPYVRRRFIAQRHGEGGRLGEAGGGESTGNIHPSAGLCISTGGSQLGEDLSSRCCWGPRYPLDTPGRCSG